MSARDEIFDNIRRSLHVTGAEAPRRAAVADRLAHSPSGVIPARGKGGMETFKAEAARAAATLTEVASAEDVPEAIASYLRERNLPASRLLMPMSLAASLGTTLTLISAPAFLLANDLIERTGAQGLGIFAITPIGIALVLLGMVYMPLVRWLLPRRSGEHGEEHYLRLDRYRTELLIPDGSPWRTRPLSELQKALGERMQVLGWLRQGENQYLAYPPEVAKYLPMPVQELIGYTVHRPNLGQYECSDPQRLLTGFWRDNEFNAYDFLTPEQEQLAKTYAA